MLPVVKNLPMLPRPVGESWEVSAMPGNESVLINGPLAGKTLNRLVDKYGMSLLGTDSVRRYGKRFPLLVKFIDAHSDLSIQVHPDDATAASLHSQVAGKTEMWYVLKCSRDAAVTLGFRQELTRSRFREIAGTEAIIDVAAKYPTHPGDAFIIPAGTLHSIGRGNLLAEIQQSSDLTYRVYDYDRTDSDGKQRPLHIDEATQAVNLETGKDLRLKPESVADGMERLVSCEHFTVHRISVSGTFALEACPDSFRVMVCTEGSVSFGDGTTINAGFSALVPACAPAQILRGHTTLLCASV